MWLGFPARLIPASDLDNLSARRDTRTYPTRGQRERLWCLVVIVTLYQNINQRFISSCVKLFLIEFGVIIFALNLLGMTV